MNTSFLVMGVGIGLIIGAEVHSIVTVGIGLFLIAAVQVSVKYFEINFDKVGEWARHDDPK